MTIEYVDANGAPLAAGDRVVFADWPKPEGETMSEAEAKGEITRISDPDGDVDDETMRHIAIPAYVCIRFDDGTEDRFPGTWTAVGPDDEAAPFRFDDIVKEDGHAAD